MSVQEKSTCCCYPGCSVAISHTKNYTSEPYSEKLIQLFKEMRCDLGELKDEVNTRIEKEKQEIFQAIDILYQHEELGKWEKHEFNIGYRFGSFRIIGFDRSKMQKLNRIFVTILANLIDSNDLDAIRKLLPFTKLENTDINVAGDKGRKVLLAAAAVGNKEIFELLLRQKNINVNEYSEANRLTPFTLLLENHHFGIAQELVERNLVDLELPDREESLAIHMASFSNDPKVLMAVLRNKNVNVNAQNLEKETPLIVASMSGSTENVRLLIEQKGIDLDALDSRGLTALEVANVMGYTEIANILSKAKEVQEEKKESEKIVSAIRFFHEKAGVDISQVESFFQKDPQTGLYTIEHLTKTCRKTLNGAFISFVTDRVLKEDFESLNLILPLAQVEGIDINASGIHDSKVLILAAARGNEKIFNLLLEQPSVDVNVCYEPLKTTVLMTLIDKGHLQIAKQLIQRDDLDLKGSDIEKQSILHFAIHTNNAEFLSSLLVDKRIDINARDIDLETALIQASAKGYLESLKVLVNQENIDLNAMDKKGCTALHSAVFYGKIECVKILLEQKEKGLDLFRRNKKNKNALEIAEQTQNLALVCLLDPYFSRHHAHTIKSRNRKPIRLKSRSMVKNGQA